MKIKIKGGGILKFKEDKLGKNGAIFVRVGPSPEYEIVKLLGCDLIVKGRESKEGWTCYSNLIQDNGIGMDWLKFPKSFYNHRRGHSFKIKWI